MPKDLRSGCRTVLWRAGLVGGVGALLAAPTVVVAERPADQAESASMVAAVQSENRLIDSVLQARLATVSTVDDRWGFLGVQTISGEAPFGMEFTDWAMQRTAVGWQTLAWGAQLETCAGLQRLGIPAAVIDDLALAAVRYRCASPPLPRLVCLLRGGQDTVGRTRPRGCDLSLEESPSPAFANLRLLRKVRWVTWTRTRAVGRGKAIPVHAPFTPYDIKVVLWRPTPDQCGPVFTRAQVTSRFGSSGKRPLLSTTTCR